MTGCSESSLLVRVRVLMEYEARFLRRKASAASTGTFQPPLGRQRQPGSVLCRRHANQVLVVIVSRHGMIFDNKMCPNLLCDKVGKEGIKCHDMHSREERCDVAVRELKWGFIPSPQPGGPLAGYVT